MNEKNSIQKRSFLTKITQSEIFLLSCALILLCVVIYCLTPVFLSYRNIMNTLRQVSLTAICGFGMTMIILLGEIDLSVGSQQAVAGIISVVVLNATGSVLLAVLAAVAAGAVVGTLNGILVTKMKLNSMVATLGTMAIWRGLSMVVTGAVSIQSQYPAFAELGTGFTGPIPNTVIIAAVLYGIVFYVLNHTTFGRKLYAVGGNAEAARLSGVPVERIKMIVYISAGMLTMLAGVLLASRMSSAQPTAGTGFEMVVISAVILGGVSMSGGSGSIAGALIGMLILGVLQNGLTLLDVSSFWQDISRGIVIILAVYLDVTRKKRAAKKLVAEQQKNQQ